EDEDEDEEKESLTLPVIETETDASDAYYGKGSGSHVTTPSNNEKRSLLNNPLGEDPTNSLRKEKVKPWFLSNGTIQFVGGSAGTMGTVPNAPRTHHQKKKITSCSRNNAKTKSLPKNGCKKNNSNETNCKKSLERFVYLFACIFFFWKKNQQFVIATYNFETHNITTYVHCHL
ncbi:hypothetical protein RFI_13992, partial [Reticulomyxa filosa]